MTQLDLSILDWIQTHLRCGFLDTIVPWISNLGNSGILWILLSIVLLIVPKTRKIGLAMAVALLLDLLLCNLLLKPLVARARPFTMREVELLVPAPTDFSFPSGHAASSFAAAGVLLFGKSRGRIPAVILASLISLSRLYLYVHYPSDVICGVLLGLFCGAAAFFSVQAGANALKKRQEKRQAQHTG